jgi:hypothetical protein
LAEQLSSASSAKPFIKIGFAATSITSFTKPSIGINPISKASDVKASPAKAPIKSSSPAKVASLVKVSSFTNESSANEPLFFLKVESSTKLPILPRQDALEPTIRQLLTMYIPIRPLATAFAALKYILKALGSIKFNTNISIDFNNLDSQLNGNCIKMPLYKDRRTEFSILEAIRPYKNKQRSHFIVNTGIENRPFY